MLCFSLGSRLRGNDGGVRGNDGVGGLRGLVGWRTAVLSLCPNCLRDLPIVSYVVGRGEGFAPEPGVLGIDGMGYDC